MIQMWTSKISDCSSVPPLSPSEEWSLPSLPLAGTWARQTRAVGLILLMTDYMRVDGCMTRKSVLELNDFFSAKGWMWAGSGAVRRKEAGGRERGAVQEGMN